jgi:sec-independent protein translocase protein TatA
MGSFSPWHLLIFALVALVLFGGRGKLSGIMGDAAKGIRAFRDGLKEEPPAGTAQPQPLPPVDRDKDPVAR